MFTWKRKWKFSVPLKIDNDIIEMKSSTRFLGVTLDSKLTWNEQCKKAKGILMQCRKAVGPTWGLTPKTMKWIYTAVVRPSGADPCSTLGGIIPHFYRFFAILKFWGDIQVLPIFQVLTILKIWGYIQVLTKMYLKTRIRMHKINK